MIIKPTTESYNELQQAFDYFNRALFNDALPSCLITYQCNKRTYGYFSNQRFTHATNKQIIDEIAMNPSYFAIRPVDVTLSTLVHEMVHQWQFHFGMRGRRGYHNKEWAEKMFSVGLIASNTGKPGGKDIGEQMTHYIDEQGAFSQACHQLLTKEFKISWYDRFPPVTHADIPSSLATLINFVEPKANRSNRIKYCCTTCGTQVWGKPNLKILCGSEECEGNPLEAQ